MYLASMINFGNAFRADSMVISSHQVFNFSVVFSSDHIIPIIIQRIIDNLVNRDKR